MLSVMMHFVCIDSICMQKANGELDTATMKLKVFASYITDCFVTDEDLHMQLKHLTVCPTYIIIYIYTY